MAALEGLLVVAIEQAVAAPLCTARLRDAGARIIKVEREEGDFARRYDTAACGDSSYFAWLNHGKESLVLDFKLAEDASVLRRILSKADVLVQNLSAGALTRAGFDLAELRTKFPALITCDISGYASDTQYHNKKAYDLLIQAESGLVDISGGPGEPGRIGVSLCDIGAGATAHAAVLEALVQRGRTGSGAGVSVSLFDVAAEWMSVPLIHAETGTGSPKREGLRHPSIAPYGAYASSDGKLTLLSIQNEREWLRFSRDVLQQEAIASDKRFVSNDARVKNRQELDDIIATITQGIDATTFRDRLQQADIAFGALNSVDEFGEHPALRRRSVINSSGRPLSLPAHPAIGLHQLDTEVNKAPAVPQIGAHTEAIRAEFT